jgi:aspartyl protease family protein
VTAKYDGASGIYTVAGATVSGHAVKFMVDTGATLTALNNSLFDLVPHEVTGEATFTLGDGSTEEETTYRVRNICVGGMCVDSLDGVTFEDGDNLLGEDFLRRFSLSIKGGVMTISKP